MRNAARRPSKSSATMIGRPVVDPRTGVPTFGIFMPYFSSRCD
jgi:hypothetical protein